MAARKSAAVGDIVPLDRGKINRKLLFVQKNMQKSLHLGLVEQSLDRSIFFQQQALVGVKGKTKSRQIILISIITHRQRYCFGHIHHCKLQATNVLLKARVQMLKKNCLFSFSFRDSSQTI